MIKYTNNKGIFPIKDVVLYDYIEGNGSSTYLDTLVNPQIKPRVVADLTFVNSADKDYWGNSAIDGSAYYADFYQYLLYYYRFGSTASINCGNAVSASSRHIYDVSDNVYLDGTLIKTTTNTYTYNSSQSTILIFKAARDNFYSDYKLHDFKLYDGDTLVRHLLPCTYLGEPGMWDTIENKFYGNQGTGSFTLGPEIKTTFNLKKRYITDNSTTKEVKKVYIGNNLIWRDALYQRLEYLESPGEPYINTGIYNDSSTIIDTKMALSGGNRLNGSETTSRYKWGTDGNGYIYYGFAGNHSSNILAALEDVYTFHMEQSNLYVKDSNGNTVLSSSETSSDFSSYPIILFRLITGGNFETLNGSGSIRIYYCNISNSTTNMQLVPVRRLSDNVLGMYDTVSKTFFTNAGSGTFVAPEEVPIINLPSGYTLLGYISSTSSGGLYIDLGCKLLENTDDIGVDIKFNIKGNGKDSLNLSTLLASQVEANPYPGFVSRKDGNGYVEFTAKWQFTDSVKVNNKYSPPFFSTFRSMNNIYEISVVLDQIPAAQIHNMNCHLFCALNGSNQPFRFVKADVYYLKLTKGNTVVRDLIPAKRNSDNEVGLYDILNNVFYPSQGTDSFVAGPEVHSAIYL